jgi:hypothetical protein
VLAKFLISSVLILGSPMTVGQLKVQQPELTFSEPCLGYIGHGGLVVSMFVILPHPLGHYCLHSPDHLCQFHRQAVNLEDNIEYFVLFYKQAVNLGDKIIVKFLNYIHCT